MNLATRLLAIVLVAACASTLGCKSSANKNGASANRVATAGGPQATTPSGGNTADFEMLAQAISAQLAAKSYRARMDTVFEEQDRSATVEFVAPDRFHMTSDFAENIAIGSNTWMKVENKSWQKSPVDMSQALKQFRNPKMLEEMRKNTTVKALGPDTLDGMPMNVFETITANAPGTDSPVHGKIWVGAADNLPRRAETVGEFKGKTSKVTITYFDYNADIKIEAPK